MNLHRNFKRAFCIALSTGCLPLTAAFAQEDQGIQPFEWSFRDDTLITLYGQINEGVLVFDDGGESTNYGLVNNMNSSNRLGVKSTTGYSNGWELFSNIEIQYVPHPSDGLNQLDKNAANYGFYKTNVRKAEIALSSDTIGKFWLGQGSMATDNITEIDLSGTTVISYSNVRDIGGGLFRFDDGTLSGISTTDAYNNYDGRREMRVRYDTPTFSGFSLRAAYGQDVLNDESDSIYDVGVYYDGVFSSVELSAGAGYARYDGTDANVYSGSASALHTPTGLSFTVAAGQQDADDDASYGYAKLGWQHDFFSVGTTAFSVDYYDGDGVVDDGSDSQTYAFAMVQDVDYWNTQWYVGVRKYDYDDDTDSYQDGLSTMAGLRVKF